VQLTLHKNATELVVSLKAAQHEVVAAQLALCLEGGDLQVNGLGYLGVGVG
jgi:hypothetical protein